MTDQGIYGQFCPVAMAAEIICSRWTALLLRELMAGSTRFNELRRGVPRMSPTLLSKRLKDLEEAGIVMQVRNGTSGVGEYQLTAAGEDLRPIIMSFGTWGQRWIDSKLSLRNLDPGLLMWDMRRMLNPDPLPKRRCTIRFEFPEVRQSEATHWLVVDPDGHVDLCSVDPGFDIDLYVSGSLHAMTAVWMGLSSVARETDGGRMQLVGDPGIASTMQHWLGLSPFARERNRQMAAETVTQASRAAT